MARLGYVPSMNVGPAEVAVILFVAAAPTALMVIAVIWVTAILRRR
jgi:hypothetical protein